MPCAPTPCTASWRTAPHMTHQPELLTQTRACTSQTHLNHPVVRLPHTRVSHRPIFQAQVEKLLKIWQIEGVFAAEQLRDVESGRGALGSSSGGGGGGLLGASGGGGGGGAHPLHSKSPSGSLTEASAQVSSGSVGGVGGGGGWC